MRIIILNNLKNNTFIAGNNNISTTIFYIEEILDVLRQVKGHKNVRKVWIAEKKLEYYPDSPVYVVVFSAKGFYTSYESVQAKVTGAIQTNEDVFVVVKAGDFKKLAKKVIKAGEIFKES